MKENSIDFKSTKRLFNDWLKEKGFISIYNKRIFLQDYGYYMIVVELVPLRDEGFMVDIGVKLLWSTYYDISYDYSNGYTRVCGFINHGMVRYDSANLESEINLLKADAIGKIESYKNLENFNTFKYSIENRDDSTQRLNPGFEKRDVSRAIAKMFSGDPAGAMSILFEGSINNPVARRLRENYDSIKQFHDELITIINECRQGMSKKFKISLAPISRIWKTE